MQSKLCLRLWFGFQSIYDTMIQPVFDVVNEINISVYKKQRMSKQPFSLILSNMETFGELKIILKRLGILQKDYNSKAIKLSAIRNFMVFQMMISATISVTVYLILVEKTEQEKMVNIFEILYALLQFAWYLTLIWKRKTYANLLLELDVKMFKSE